MGARVQIMGRNRSGTVTGTDERRGVTVRWDDGGSGTIAPNLLRVVAAPTGPPPPPGGSGGRGRGGGGGGAGRGRPPGGPPGGPEGGGGGEEEPPVPKARDLIPVPGQPWDKDKAEEGMRQLLEGRDFAGYTIVVADVSGRVMPNGESYLYFTAGIHKNGTPVGTMSRRWNRDPDGTLSAYNDYQELEPEHRGKGFAPVSGRYLEQVYKDSGFDRVEVYASLQDGGYTWASSGFDFVYEHEAEERLYALQEEMERLQRRVSRWTGPTDAPGYERMVSEIAAAEQIMQRWQRFEFGDPGFPTAREISQVGRRPGESIRERTWLGLRAMRGSSWDGVKKL
ncbi:hypothetical protein ACQP10_37915 (plasmid) [Streptosporangium sandarakinum]|uniref:hypothetical protein n=1 Tax=Streptosporangium sandarakinum TaxID=1260955 RepID=UPI003D8F1FEF